MACAVQRLLTVPQALPAHTGPAKWATPGDCEARYGACSEFYGQRRRPIGSLAHPMVGLEAPSRLRLT